MTERGGAIIICRIVAPPNAPPQTPQYYNYLNDRESTIIFLAPPIPLPLSPTPQYLTILNTGKGGANIPGACPGGGAQGAWAPPPLEIEKQKKKKKKKKKKVIRVNINLFRLYFATFLVDNVIFSASFWAGPRPWKIEKQKKKKKKKKRLSDFGPHPPANSWTRACIL